MITDLYLDQTLDFLRDLPKSAKVTINGTETEHDIFRTLVEGQTIKHFVYLSNETGVITSAKLIDAQQRDLQTKTYNVTKGPDGFTIVFVTELKIEEA